MAKRRFNAWVVSLWRRRLTRYSVSTLETSPHFSLAYFHSRHDFIGSRFFCIFWIFLEGPCRILVWKLHKRDRFTNCPNVSDKFCWPKRLLVIRTEGTNVREKKLWEQGKEHEISQTPKRRADKCSISKPLSSRSSTNMSVWSPKDQGCSVALPVSPMSQRPNCDLWLVAPHLVTSKVYWKK